MSERPGVVIAPGGGASNRFGLSSAAGWSHNAVRATHRDSLAPSSAPGPHGPQARSFDERLDYLRSAGIEDRWQGAGGANAARDTAEQLVAITLVQPILSASRAMNQAAAPWGPTQGDKAFGAMMDAQAALGMVRAGGWKIVDRIEADLIKQAALNEQSAAGGA